MRTGQYIKSRALALIVALVFLPVALMGGVCVVCQHYADDCGVVVTQDVCGAKAPGTLSISTYAAAISDAMPPAPIIEVSTTPPTACTAFVQDVPGEADKPPQVSSRA
jgi:hypothetical protein